MIVIKHPVLALARRALPLVLTGFDPSDVNDIIDNGDRDIDIIGVPHQIDIGLVIFVAGERPTDTYPIATGDDRDPLWSPPLN
jgi:hypothetical protein